MKKLVQEKEKAIALRKKGHSYREIMGQVPVAKSSLSLWLKDLPLTKSEKQVLKKRKDKNISQGRIRAASELRKRRLDRELVWYGEVEALFKMHKDNPLFHAGIVMYWAEGAKTDSRWMIINTDVEVIELMKFWVEKFLSIDKDYINYRLFIHRSYDDGDYEKWWQDRLRVKSSAFLKTVYKDTPHKTKLKKSHQGCLRIELKNSKKYLYTMKILRKLAVEYYKKQ